MQPIKEVVERVEKEKRKTKRKKLRPGEKRPRSLLGLCGEETEIKVCLIPQK